MRAKNPTINSAGSGTNFAFHVYPSKTASFYLIRSFVTRDLPPSHLAPELRVDGVGAGPASGPVPSTTPRILRRMPGAIAESGSTAS